MLKENVDFKIKDAISADIDVLTEIFWDNLLLHPQYISHGEVQMGVATGLNTPACNGKEMWRKYISGKINSEDSHVFICRNYDSSILGFTVLSIEEDGADPFGVICDLLTLPQSRGKGIGGALLDAGREWFRGKGIKSLYLESGKDNHSAHAFFEKRGFRMLSHIYSTQC